MYTVVARRLALVATLIAPVAFAQRPSVRKINYPGDDMTVVESGRLTLADTPAQFVALEFAGRSPHRQQPVEPPAKIVVKILSYSTQPLYRKDDAHRLMAVTDEGALDLGALSYAAFEGKPGAAKDIYTFRADAGMTIRFPLPRGAQVRSGSGDVPLVAESMSADKLRLEQLERLANSRRLELRLGDSSFVLNDAQSDILREFLRALMTPGGAVDFAEPPDPSPPSPEVDANAPSDENNAPLDQTLSWLKEEINARSSVRTPGGTRIRMAVVAADNCELRYRIGGRAPEDDDQEFIFAPSIEFVVKLSDLNPESVRVNDAPADRTLISFAAVDHEKKIGRLVLEGGTDRVLARSWEDGGLLDLRKTRSAFRIRDALRHAVKLCRSQQ